MLVLLLRIILFLVLDTIWWLAADRRVRRLPRARLWRGLVAAFMTAQIAYLLLFTGVSLIDDVHEFGPLVWRTTAYLWHLLVLPTICLGLIFTRLPRLTKRLWASRGTGAIHKPLSESNEQPTRRETLAAVAALLPPLATGILTIHAIRKLGEFQVRRFTIGIPNLPADLDGLAILHLTDLHIGKFLPAGAADRIIDAANALPADLVVFTGDLFDVSATDLQPGIDFIRRLDPRSGLAMIQGNHDVMAYADWFEQGMKAARLPLLLDESVVYRVSGRSTPVQLLGLTWGELKLGSELNKPRARDRLRHFRVTGEDATRVSLQHLQAQRRPDAFPILLAHHPHVFDEAAGLGLPLVLAGHTHGGQIMLTENVGFGPVRFRYWSGLYEKPNSRLLVSKGLGNWFPLRCNAPAEITHLTLRKT